MGNFYGYSPENFVPDTSHWERMFGQAAQTILQIPQVMEAEKALQEGRETNDGIYEGLKTELSNMKDEDVKTYFGYDKATLLKMTKPGRNEGLEYFPRFAKITGEGLKSVYAMKNLTEAQGRISAIGRNMDVADEVRGVMVDQTFKGAGMNVQGDISKLGYDQKNEDGTTTRIPGQSAPAGESSPVMKPIANYATPEQVQGIATKYNVPLDKLQPEMDIANNRIDAQQLRQIDPTKTQAINRIAIGGEGRGLKPITAATIGTLPTETQEASAMISAANTENDRYKAITDRMKAGNDATKERRQSRNELINLKKTYQNEIKVAQTELSKVMDDLQKPAPLGADEDTMKEWESTHKSLVNRQKSLTRDLRNAKREANEADKLLKQENGIPVETYIDDEVWDAYDQVTGGSESDLPGMNDPQYKKQNEAYSLAEVASKTWGISVSPEVISNEIKNGATPLQILQALFENVMGR